MSRFYAPDVMQSGGKYQLMTKSCLRDGTETAVYAKQHDVFARAIAFEINRWHHWEIDGEFNKSFIVNDQWVIDD